MKLKKTLAFLLCAVLIVLAVAGCGQKPAAGAEDQLAAIQKAGKFIVGIEGTYPPFTYHDDDGNLVGYDVEVAAELAKKLGVEVEFVEAAWDSLLIGVDTGRFDTVINNVSVTEERQGKYDFSEPYYYSARQVVVRGDNTEINGEDDLKGKKVATNLTNAFIDWYEDHGAQIVGIDTGGEAFEMLLSGRVDFTGSSPVIVNDYLAEHPDASLRIAFVIPDSESCIAVPVRKGETRLLDAINKALDEMRADGTLLALSQKYLNGDYTVSAFAK